MAKWKYKNPKKRHYVQYLRFDDGEVKDITISEWDFTKNPSGYLFKCYVTKENGEAVDKIWTVWDYDSAQLLKKKLRVKYISGSAELKVRMIKKDEEITFEVL